MNRGVIALFSVVALIGVGALFAASQNTSPTPPEPNTEQIRNTLPELTEDEDSVNTILYGYKIPGASVINAVNDSGRNHTKISVLAEDIKFVYPLKNKTHLF